MAFLSGVITLLLISYQIQAKQVVMTIGDHVRIPSSKKLFIENRKILEAEDHGSYFTIKAKGEGLSNVKLNDGLDQYVVLSFQQKNTYSILKKVSQSTLNTKVVVKNNKVIIEGRIQDWNDWQRYYEACLSTNCDYLFQAKMDDEVFNKSLSEIHKILMNKSLPVINIEKSNYYFTELAKKSTYFKKMKSILDRLGIETEMSDYAIDVAPIVNVQITVAEVKKDYMQRFGIKWPAAYSSQTLSDQSETQLHALETSGAGKILAKPNILCRSGKEAEFIAGGEFPIKILNTHIQEVIWKKYGVLLKVKPTADYSGRIALSLQTEISSIDPQRTVDGIPALFTNRVQSHFDLYKSKTIALSGLIKSEESQNTEGLPWISRIPILGNLFSSKEFRENKSELIIFVKPEIFNPQSQTQNTQTPESL